jgi:Holliday junction resolvase
MDVDATFEGVVSAYDSVRIPMSGKMRAVVDIAKLNTETTLAYSMKISNFFDFGVAGVLPGVLMEDGAHVITPMWSKTGIVSLAINDGQSAKEYVSRYKLKRNRWITVKLCVHEDRNVRLWIDDAMIVEQKLYDVGKVTGIAMYCQRFGGTSHSVVSMNTIQVWSGECGLVESLNIPGHDEL